MRAKTGRCEGRKAFGHTEQERATISRVCELHNQRLSCAQIGKRPVSTSGRSVGGCGRWPEVDTYESVHLGNKWTLRSGQSLRESHRDDGGRWERSAGSSNRL